MSALPETEFKQLPPIAMARRERVLVAPVRPVALDSAAVDTLSPTTSIQKVLLTIGIALVLGLLLNARSIRHDADGMNDGVPRDVTIHVSDVALWISGHTGLTWPRDRIDAALGNTIQPSIPPLLQIDGNGAQTELDIPAVDPPMQQIGSLGAAPRFAPPKGGGLIAAVVRPSATRVPPSPSPLPSQTPIPTGTTVPTATRAAGCLGTSSGTCERPAVKGPAGAKNAHSIVPASSSGAHQTTSSCARWHDSGCRPRPTVPPQPTETRTPRPTATPRPTVTPSPTVTPTVGPPPRVITGAATLRLLVTGDSLSGYIAPQLVDKAAAVAPVTGFVDTHNGTGLTRPDFVDWSIVAAQQVAADQPDAVVVIMGGNDFQNMTLPNGQVFQAGTPVWTREYQRRAEICMRIWAQGGLKRVYWLSMPPARNSTWAADDRQINKALQAAAADVPGARFLNVLGPVTDHGKYVDYVHWHGGWLLIREPDGVHLNQDGSLIVADEVLNVIKREWHI